MALECIRYSITSQSREGIVQLGSALGWPHLEFWGRFWMPQYNRDLKFLDSVQSGAVEMVRCLEGKPYEEWLMSLCSAWRRGHWGGTSLQSATSSWGREEGKTLISSPWWPVAGPGETQWSCVRGGLDIKKSFYIQWMIGTPEKLGTAQVWRSSRNTWTILSGIWGGNSDSVQGRAQWSLWVPWDSCYPVIL